MLVARDVAAREAAQTSTSTEAEGGCTTDKQKFQLKLAAALAAGLGGWVVTLTSWSAALTPIAMGGLLMIIGSVLGGVFGITTPSDAHRVDLALLAGVHTIPQVDALQKATAPGVIPTPDVIKAVLKDAPPDPPPTVPAAGGTP